MLLKIQKKSLKINIDIAECGSKDELGKTIGKESRAVIGICDENFAVEIKEYLGIL